MAVHFFFQVFPTSSSLTSISFVFNENCIKDLSVWFKDAPQKRKYFAFGSVRNWPTNSVQWLGGCLYSVTIKPKLGKTCSPRTPISRILREIVLVTNEKAVMNWLDNKTIFSHFKCHVYFMYLEKEPKDLASQMFSPSFFVIHDTSRSGHHNVTAKKGIWL